MLAEDKQMLDNDKMLSTNKQKHNNIESKSKVFSETFDTIFIINQVSKLEILPRKNNYSK